MIDVVALVIGLAGLITLSALLMGCIQWFHRLVGPKNVPYQQDIESSMGSSQTIIPDQGPMFPPAESVENDNDSLKGITFEPLPDIVGKAPVHEPALRPRVSSVERASEQVRFGGSRYEIPRSQLFFVNEMGSGWFGQVLQGDAERIRVGQAKTKVVIKVLKDNATPREQLQFLKEVLVYRDLDHVNVLLFMGQCTETIPYLTILEHITLGDLKTYLLTNRGDREAVLQRGSLLKFASEMAAGLACMHRHDFVHRDFATRNCLVTHDLSIKVGDYGVSEEIYKNDYMDIGEDDMIPVRWMAPETVTVQQGDVMVTEITQSANVWSFGVSLWELCEFGGQPYSSLTNEEVITQVMVDRFLQLPEPSLQVDWRIKMYDVLKYCWMEQRPTIDTVHKALQQLQAGVQDNTAEFDAKWDQIVPKKARVINVSRFPSSSERRPPLEVVSNGIGPLGGGKTELIVMADVMMEDHSMSELPVAKAVQGVKAEPDTGTPSKNGNGDVKGFRMTSTPVTKADTPSSYNNNTAAATSAAPSNKSCLILTPSMMTDPVQLPTESNMDDLSLSNIEPDPVDAVMEEVAPLDEMGQTETEPDIAVDLDTKNEVNEAPSEQIQPVKKNDTNLLGSTTVEQTEKIVDTGVSVENEKVADVQEDVTGDNSVTGSSSSDLHLSLPDVRATDDNSNTESARVEPHSVEVALDDGGGLLIDVDLETQVESSANEDGANVLERTEGEVTNVVPLNESADVEAETTPAKEMDPEGAGGGVFTESTPPQTASIL